MTMPDDNDQPECFPHAFSTGQAAKLLGVVPRTIAEWMDSGRLRGYRGPGNLGRRIPREALRAFMVEYGLSMDALDAEEEAQGVE